MASSKEVLKDWLKQGKYLDDDSVIDSLYNMKAPTDELAEQRFLGMYGNRAPFDKADRIEEPTIPSMDNIIGILGLSDDPKEAKDARTKEQKFIEDFPKKLNEWKKKIENNPVYGKRGWETVKKIWQHALERKRLSDTAKARYDAVNDGTLSGFATRTLLPRVTERIANTGDFTAKDMLADIGENAAMTIPGGAFTGVAGKGLAKVAPRAVRYFSGPGKNILEGAVKGAGRMAGNIYGNAVVPFASEAMDAAIYGDDDEGMEQRADFSTGDALMGTAINQGVNRGLMRMLGPMVDRFSQGGLARGGTLKARQFLEQLGVPFSKRGDDFAQEVAERVAIPDIVEKGAATNEGVKFVTRGGDNLAPGAQSQEALENAVKAQAVVDAINSGKITFDPKRAKDAANYDWQTDVAKKKSAAKNDLDIAELQAKDKWRNVNEFVNDGSKEAKQMQQSLMQDAVDAEQKVSDAADRLKNVDALDGTEKAAQVSNMFNYNIGPDDVYPSRNILNDVVNRNPAELVNYAAWHGVGDGAIGRTDRILNAINQDVPAWGVNKLGSESDATMLLSPLPTVKKAIDENRKEVHDAPKKRRTASDVLKVVSDTGDLTEQDRKFLNAIAENPDIMKFGYKDDPNAFRLWLLERGNQLLNGTSAFRPTFGVD